LLNPEKKFGTKGMAENDYILTSWFQGWTKVMDEDKIALDESWKQLLRDEFNSDYMQQLKRFLMQRYEAKKIIYPKGSEYFAALNLTPFDKVKVVILGQDPYHGPHQAHGLCFSVRPGVTPPPSLVNIYKELEQDVGFKSPSHGYLEAWARQGVLLLNSVLTVEQGAAGSHRNKGWERFTDKIITLLNENKQNLVFLLWGAYAQEKGHMIDPHRHLILKAAHPSPFSAYRGFLGCRHFSKANAYLREAGHTVIDWNLPLKV
jgi:uracil-DNA glycosylase